MALLVGRGNAALVLLIIVAVASGAASCSSEQGGVDATEEERLGTTHQASTGTTTPPPDCPVGDETLQDYSKSCAAAMDGIEMPSFDCDGPNSVEVPDTNSSGGSYPNQTCDRPNVLNGVCDQGSRFQMAVTSGDVRIVAHCRRKWNGPGNYNDIAMIAHNQRTGDTCFFQNTLTDMSGVMPSPKDGTNGRWKSPADVAGINCVQCHDNGPFIRTPYFTQLKGTPNTELGRPEDGNITAAQTLAAQKGAIVPGSRDTTGNSSQPYRFVGKNFQQWKAYKLLVKQTKLGGTQNKCVSCHRLGVSSSVDTSSGPAFNRQAGTGIDFSIRATASTQSHKNPHGLGSPGSRTSPIWMLMTQSVYDQTIADEASLVAACATNVANGKPLVSTCTYSRFAQGSTCSGVTTQIGADDSTQSPPSTVPSHSSQPLPVGGNIAFFYWSTIHGPFEERSKDVRYGQPGFDGTYLRITATSIDSGWDGPVSNIPRAPAGGRVDATNFVDIQGVPDASQCGSTIIRLEDLIGQSDSSRTVDSGRKGIDTLSLIIGNAAIGPAARKGAFLGLDEQSSLTVLQKRQPKGAFEAEAWSSGCKNWTPTYEATNVESQGDVVLLPAARASKARCFITGISGDWSQTRANASIQPYAEIYYDTAGVHLHVVPVDAAVPIGAYASCIQLKP